jgi:hypothetical protein
LFTQRPGAAAASRPRKTDEIYATIIGATAAKNAIAIGCIGIQGLLAALACGDVPRERRQHESMSDPNSK